MVFRQFAGIVSDSVVSDALGVKAMGAHAACAARSDHQRRVHVGTGLLMRKVNATLSSVLPPGTAGAGTRERQRARLGVGRHDRDAQAVDARRCGLQAPVVGDVYRVLERRAVDLRGSVEARRQVEGVGVERAEGAQRRRARATAPRHDGQRLAECRSGLTVREGTRSRCRRRLSPAPRGRAPRASAGDAPSRSTQPRG